MHEALTAQYPVSHHLEDGAKVTCSLMSHDDAEPLSKFLGRLTRKDLAYLQADIADPNFQKRWIDSMGEGKAVGLCAYDPAGLVGYAAVQVLERGGQRHGEIRVNIGPGYRSRGLGRILTREIFIIAKLLNLSLVTARMLTDQHGARAAFERLGFKRKEVLENYVKDSSVNCRDLLVMTSDLQ